MLIFSDGGIPTPGREPTIHRLFLFSLFDNWKGKGTNGDKIPGVQVITHALRLQITYRDINKQQCLLIGLYRSCNQYTNPNTLNRRAMTGCGWHRSTYDSGKMVDTET